MTEPPPTEPVAGPAENDAPLPEGFFDDPIQDAKARGIEYKVNGLDIRQGDDKL